MKTGTIRGSSSSKLGKLDQLLGFTHLDGLGEPWIRRFIPWMSWPVLSPVSTATQFQGCGLAHRALEVLGHAVPWLRSYSGTHPTAISSRSFAVAGSQSRAWFWLPLGAPKRSSTTGSSTLSALSWRFCLMPIFATTLWVQEGCTAEQRSNEFAQPEPPSHSCAKW